MDFGPEEAHSSSDVDVAELIEAFNDPHKAEILMRERGWTESDLIARAEAVTRSLSEGVASVNCV